MSESQWGKKGATLNHKNVCKEFSLQSPQEKAGRFGKAEGTKVVRVRCLFVSVQGVIYTTNSKPILQNCSIIVR